MVKQTANDQLKATAAPEMSVVIVTPDRYETIRKAVGHVRAQTARDRLELIIVAPSLDALGECHLELKEFAWFRLVEAAEIQSVSAAHVLGIREASAPVVALVEEHVYPDPDWAQALIAAHRQGWAAVGPAVRPANPTSTMSWADFLISYGPWMEPAAAGTRKHLPGHNSSYKKAVLLAYGPDLEDVMEAESVLHWDLRRKGHQLYLEPAARIRHVNFERLSPWLGAAYYSGRMFAATRARSWSWLRRLLYAGGAPLIPIVRFWRILAQVCRSRRWRGIPIGSLPLAALGLITSALGEMTGYTLGTGKAKEKAGKFEFHRLQHVLTRGRKAEP